jgi:hypothetical protein
MHARCSHCQSRRTLSKKPTEYLRLPKCRMCGRRRYYLDHYRRNVERKAKPCRCHFIGHPHRKGGGSCIHNSNYTEQYEIQQRRANASSW